MRAAAFATAGLLAGAVVGALLGALGSAVDGLARLGVATTLASLAALVGALELAGRRTPLFQVDRETPKIWLDRESELGWAVRQGIALGVGATSRLGFPLWYVVPIAAVLSGSAAAGAAVFAAYALARTGATIAVILLLADRGRDASYGVRLMRAHRAARRLAGAILLLVGTAAALALGL